MSIPRIILNVIDSETGEPVQLTEAMLVGAKTVLKLKPLDSAPTGAKGQIYFNDDDHHFYGYNGQAWVQLDNE